jgi:hypothetical protein
MLWPYIAYNALTKAIAWYVSLGKIRYNRELGSFHCVAMQHFCVKTCENAYRAIITGNYSSQNFDNNLLREFHEKDSVDRFSAGYCSGCLR